MPAKCQAMTEVFALVCAWTVGQLRLVVKMDKYWLRRNHSKSMAGQVQVVISVYHVSAKLRPRGNMPELSSISKIERGKNVLDMSSTVDPQVHRV